MIIVRTVDHGERAKVGVCMLSSFDCLISFTSVPASEFQTVTFVYEFQQLSFVDQKVKVQHMGLAILQLLEANNHGWIYLVKTSLKTSVLSLLTSKVVIDLAMNIRLSKFLLSNIRQFKSLMKKIRPLFDSFD